MSMLDVSEIFVDMSEVMSLNHLHAAKEELDGMEGGQGTQGWTLMLI